MTLRELIEQLQRGLAAKLEQRGTLTKKQEDILARCKAENERAATAEEEAEIRGVAAEKHKIDDETEVLRSRIAELEDEERRDNAAAQLRSELGDIDIDKDKEKRGVGGARVGHEPGTYQRGGQNSYFRDMTLASIRNDRGAQDRLQRNSAEVATDLKERALSTTDGAGGELVPPVWMMDEFINLARAARVTADRVRRLPLPPGTDSINLPRLATGTAVAEQATQNTNVQNTDATTNSIEAKVTTIAGAQTVAVQMIEQSPINIDDVLLADLAADYAVKLDVFVLNSNATGKKGLLNVTGLNSVTYTDVSPTPGELYAKLADALQQINTGRLMPADIIVMHPRRWAMFLGALDGQGRPLVVPNAQGPMNSIGSAAPNTAEGLAGWLQGLPVYVDPNVPTNLGAGTNEDRVIVARSQDVILFEGNPNSEAFRETKAEQLSVLLRFYNYVALHSERYPKAISVISGTGLVPPTF